MASRRWFFRRSHLQLALERGTQPGAELDKELRGLDDRTFRTRADAEAICEVLARVVSAGSTVGGRNAFNALVQLFDDVDGVECPAYAIMAERGIALILQVVNEALQNPSRLDSDDLLVALVRLAGWGTRHGTDAVIRAARQTTCPEDTAWGMILAACKNEPPERERLFRELSDPLPSAYLAFALINSANGARREGAEFPHPFDSAAGMQHMERMLIDYEQKDTAHAVIATMALPFISAPGRDRLLALAFEHSNADVQLQAARTAAELGRDSGVKWLVRACLDVNLSERAKWHLTELDRTDAIPPEAEDERFHIRAHFADWLAHPLELGYSPEEVEIVDHRVLNWPPTGEPIAQWLVRFRAKHPSDKTRELTEIGLVGSMTFCLFEHKMEQRPHEDCYAIHCYTELIPQGLIKEKFLSEDDTEYDRMLKQCKLDGLTEARMDQVAELSPELRSPQKPVAVAKVKRHGKPGWIVLDGPRSRWYPASEMPAGEITRAVLMIHVGRALLEFPDEPDRRKYLRPPQPTATEKPS